MPEPLVGGALEGGEGGETRRSTRCGRLRSVSSSAANKEDSIAGHLWGPGPTHVFTLAILVLAALASQCGDVSASRNDVIVIDGEEEQIRVRIGGYVGCLFDAGVCLDSEYCFDDNLFGSCRKLSVLGEPGHSYHLSSEQADDLGQLLERLISDGHQWRHLYTQCILTSYLLEYRGEAMINPLICEAGAVSRKPEVAQDGFPLVEDDGSLERVKTSDGSNENDAGEFLPSDNKQNYYDESEVYNIDEVNKRTILDERDRDINYDDDNDYTADDDDQYGVHPWSVADKGERLLRSDDDVDRDIDEILNNLSDKQLLDVLDKLIVNIDEQQKLNDAEVKKSMSSQSEVKNEVQYIQSDGDPATITRVVVSYNPEGDPDDELVSDSQTAESSEDEANKSESGDYQQNASQEYEEEKTDDTVDPNDHYEYNINIDQIPEKPSVIDENENKIEIASSTAASLPQNVVKVPAPLSLSSLDLPARLKTPPASVLSKAKSNNFDRGVLTKPVSVVGNTRKQKYLVAMFVLCGVVGAAMLGAIVVFFKRRHARFKEKISGWSSAPKGDVETTGEYQDLCRQHMQSKLSEKTIESRSSGHRTEGISAGTISSIVGETVRTSSGSSTSSWSEEPVTSNMDISTGHLILSYMENHLQNKDRLQKEWDLLCAYDAEPCSIVAAIEPINMRKNRYTDILPYEHCRVKLNTANNVSSSDYINASNIMDHDPRNPAYIATQGPLPHTVADFWQMIWEQGSVVIVNLTRLVENAVAVCNRYWPEEGSDLYHIYEVHLVSEHTWCEDYLVRSFYLKNLQTNETRTITQFHFLSWPNLGVPGSTKVLLDFRRKVNRSYKGRSCPVVVHCSDGAGRTGTYCLIDMVLNRLSKGAKEIDIAATLEHIRDQRINMVRTKEQFEFALAAVAQEVHTMLQVPSAP